MSLGRPTLNDGTTFESQKFGPAATTSAGYYSQPAMYASGDIVAYWQPYKGWNLYQHYHNGLDIAGPFGTPLLALERGTVTYSAWRSNGGGYVMEVEIRPGTKYTFNHCSSLLVPTGRTVLKGQTIARIGSTGIATGNHCHISLEINERGTDGITRTLVWNPKLFMAGGPYANDARIQPPSLPDTGGSTPTPPTTTVKGLPVSFKNRTGWKAQIIKGKPRRSGATIASSNYGNTTQDESVPIWGEVVGENLGVYGLPGGTRWFFMPQYIGSWKVVYIPYADLKNRNF
jgi:peptidase M23-like protein